MPRVRCMLIVSDGPSRRVDASGILIGRSHDCDVVVTDPTVSRRHALVRLTREGAEVVPLGRAPIDHNGKAVERAAALADGDTLALPGCEIRVEVTTAGAASDGPATFRLARRRGGSFGLVHSPFVLGGGESDDLVLRRWPERALYFHVVGGELFVEVTRGKATRNGGDLANDTLEPLAAGDELEYRKETFQVLAPRGGEATTLAAGQTLPHLVTIELLPRGGRVVFSVGDLALPVYLADRRFDLVMALARPPGAYAAGDFIPDDVLGPIVWPRKPVTRTEINVLISRCRRDLVEAGISGPRLIERAPGGGGTRLALAPNGRIAVET